MATPKYAVKRARVHLEKYGTGVLEDAFNVESASASFDEQFIEKQSTSEIRGVLAKELVSTAGTFTITLGSTDFDTFVRATRSKESAQAAVADGAFTFPALTAGQSFKLPHTKITAIAVPGKVENVDYVVYKASGIVKALVDFVEAVPGGSYSAGVARLAGITAAGTVEYTVHITDELEGEYTQFFKFSPNLPTNLQYVSANEFGQYEITGTLMLDESRPATGDLGQFGFKSA